MADEPGTSQELGSSQRLATQFSESSARVEQARHDLKKGKAPNKKDQKDLKKEIEMDEHTIPIEDLFARLNTDPNQGLSSEVHRELLQRYGLNKMTPPKEKSEILKIIEHLFYGFAMLLWIGAILCIVGYILDTSLPNNLYLAVVLITVVVVTGLFAYYQESKSGAIMDSFKKMTPDHAMVLRDGSQREVNAEELVIGDIVYLNTGDKVPADIRILESINCKVDNSSLTGESDPQARSSDPTDENPLETKNLAFFTTLVVEGSSKGVVINTGDDTVIGRIAGLATSTGVEETPIQKEISHFIHIISGFAMVIGGTFFIIGLFVYDDLITNLVFAIGIIVATVPEGLLATVMVSLTLTSKRMAAKNVLVKNLQSVETLGSTTTICSDKTGTLTQNRMTVAHMYYDQNIYAADTSLSQGAYNKDSATFQELLRIMAVSNKSFFDLNAEVEGIENPKIIDRPIRGSPSEAALTKFVQPIRDVEEFRRANPSIERAAILFNSTNKFQVTVHQMEQNPQRLVVMMKGAPERILKRCNSVMVNGEVVPLDEEWSDRIEKANETLGGMGERVLGFSLYFLDESWNPHSEFITEPDPNYPIEGLCFIGLVSLIDPPRPSVPDAVRLCQLAGIRVVMVTGDHPTTAKAIAKQVNIIRDDTAEDVAARRGIKISEVERSEVKAIVVTGTTLKDMTEEELDEVLTYEQIVFARTSPQQKLRIVEGFQRQQQIVAVTGDGVNDSPALKKADIGIAMGIAGSQVSKEAADMILRDDNFSSIVKGVEEGRLIFDNLKKSIAYTLSSKIPETMPFICFIILQIPLPLGTVLILCVDVGTDLLPAISLSYEKPESDIMKRRPRNAQTDRLVTRRLISYSYAQIGIMQALAGFFSYVVLMGDYGFPAADLIGLSVDFHDEDKYILINDRVWDFDDRDEVLRRAQTAYFVTIVLVQMADLMICKTRKLSMFHQGMKNNVMNTGIFVMFVIAAGLTYIPPLNVGLGTVPLRFVHWLPPVPFSFFIFVYDEIRKFLMRRSPGGWIEVNTYY